ncbi:hypothetical protein GRX03_06705 [Halovenus sp. WSH3]|uniref:DUF8048 domain-containing protein n=1 Tax=Halovenus carboxidivorans TaxID=2692199 RepID=A0A6B0T007_9EURY|nr:hypothetical protein [Halovenus carboxidivorans]
MEEPSHPIEGQVVLLAGAKASVSLARLSDLLADVQEHLVGRVEEYDRRFERIDTDRDGVYFLAEEGRWETVGEAVGLTERETEAVARTHAEQFKRDGRRMDRREEFETSLEIRDVLAVNPVE